jgi:hypothetical protein
MFMNKIKNYYFFGFPTWTMIAAHDVRMNVAAGQDLVGVVGRDEDVVQTSSVIVLPAIRPERFRSFS